MQRDALEWHDEELHDALEWHDEALHDGLEHGLVQREGLHELEPHGVRVRGAQVLRDEEPRGASLEAFAAEVRVRDGLAQHDEELGLPRDEQRPRHGAKSRDESWRHGETWGQ